MKTRKPRPRKNPTEYRLLITPYYDEMFKRTVGVVGLRTTKEFNNFQYELVVEDSIEGSTLTLHIRGLRTPQGKLPTHGTASFYKEYEAMKQIKTIVVRKMEKKEATFEIQYKDSGAKVKKTPDDSFVEIVTDRKEW